MGVLDQLEAQVDALPPAAVKHDMDPGFDAMATWIEHQRPVERAAIIAALPAWLSDHHRWHNRAVIEIALRLRSQQLLGAAIAEARSLGVPNSPAGADTPSWMTFQLNLLAVISRWPEDPGAEARAYLEHLRRDGLGGSTYSRRLLGIRAWFTECLLDTPGERGECLNGGMTLLRSWRDRRLLQSGLSLLHAYFAASAADVAMLRRLLTRDEFKIAFPDQGIS